MKLPKTSQCFWSIFSLHLIIALYCKYILSVDISAQPGYESWENFWQVIPLTFLKEDAIESIFLLHSQPPFFNLICAALVKLFPSDPIQALHILHIFIGACLSASSWYLLSLLAGHNVLTLGIGLLLALHPSTFLYEAYPLYDLIAATLCTLSALCVARIHSSPSRRWFIGFCASLALMILTRSAFHLILFIPAVMILRYADTRAFKKNSLIVVIACVLPFSWYLKNYMQYGFFGSSSWFGQNLFRAASAYPRYFPETSLEALASRGVIDPMCSKEKFFSQPQEYIKYGFSKESQYPLLNQNDLNNINIIEISNVYKRNALRIVQDNPMGYITGVAMAFSIFLRPSYDFGDIGVNRAKIPILTALYFVLQENIFASLYIGPLKFNTIFSLLLPLLIVVGGAYAVARNRFSKALWLEYVEQEAPLIWCYTLCTYSTLIFCLFEFGENQRHKFSIEHVLIVSCVVMVLKCVEWVRGRSHSE